MQAPANTATLEIDIFQGPLGGGGGAVPQVRFCCVRQQDSRGSDWQTDVQTLGEKNLHLI